MLLKFLAPSRCQQLLALPEQRTDQPTRAARLVPRRDVMLPHHCQEIRTSLPTPTLQSSLVPRKPAKACRGLNKGAKGESSRCRYCRRPGRVEDALYAAPALPHLVQYFPCTAPLRRKPSRVSRTISTGLWSGTHQLPQILLSLPSMAKVALFAAGAVGVALAAWPLVSW